MNINLHNLSSLRRQAALAMVETLVVVAIIGTLFLSLYGGISSGFAVVNLARENLRANQIALEKMETIRLYTWEQINSNGFVAPTFTAPFFPQIDYKQVAENRGEEVSISESGSTGEGFTYYGSVMITNAPADIPSEYSGSLKRVIVSITWTNGAVARTREMDTLVSEYGMQNYIY
jgi:type II secretory pathway pseudopilin PulG